MADHDKPGGGGDGGFGSDPRGPSTRASIIPPPRDRKSLPHRDRRLFNEQRRVSLLASENEAEPAPTTSNRFSGYTAEVKRRNLLDEEDAPPVIKTRAPSLHGENRRSQEPNPFAEVPRTGVGPAYIPPAPRFSVKPGPTATPTMARASVPTAPRTSSSTPSVPQPRPPSGWPPSGQPSLGPSPGERRSLGTALKAFIRGPELPVEDPRFAQAQDNLSNGRRVEACLRLEDLLADLPDHAAARALLVAVALDMKQEERVRANIDFALLDCARAQDHDGLCELYRNARTAFPQLRFGERALLAVLVAGEKAGQGRVVVDMTKILLRDFPQSQALPRAFMASAHVQQSQGRIDLAKHTLETLLVRFPFDPLAAHARQKLAELTLP